jgi:hypothetical protein
MLATAHYDSVFAQHDDMRLDFIGCTGYQDLQSDLELK